MVSETPLIGNRVGRGLGLRSSLPEPQINSSQLNSIASDSGVPFVVGGACSAGRGVEMCGLRVGRSARGGGCALC
jgi:hypothetical protein